MNASRLKELVVQVPFAPFNVRLNDGTEYRIDYQWQVATGSNSPTFVYYSSDPTDEATHHIAYRNITEVIVESIASDANN